MNRSNIEQRLIKFATERDTASAKELYDLNVQYLTSVCSRYVINRDDVKDVLQESFVKIFNSLDSFEYRGDGSLRAWMRKIVVNESLMFLRNKARSGTLFFEEEPPDVIDDEDPMTDGVPPEEIQKMIRSLPTGYRTVFNLYVFEQKSHREISGILGISENTSYSQLCRAKSLLSKKIKEYLHEQ